MRNRSVWYLTTAELQLLALSHEGNHTEGREHSLPVATETSIGTAPAAGPASAVPASAPASGVAP